MGLRPRPTRHRGPAAITILMTEGFRTVYSTILDTSVAFGNLVKTSKLYSILANAAADGFEFERVADEVSATAFFRGPATAPRRPRDHTTTAVFAPCHAPVFRPP